jgi:predicted kinase
MSDRLTARQRRVATLRARFGWTAPSCAVPALVVMSGLPGTGKSHLAAALAARFECAVLRSDEVRKALFPEPRYTNAENGIVYLSCYALVEALLADRYSVIFDATNLLRRGRKRALKIAERAGAPSLVLVTTSPAAVVAERLRRRGAGEAAAYSSDADWAVHELLAGTLQAVTEPAVVVDTSVSLEPAFAAVEALLAQAAATSETRTASSTQHTPGTGHSQEEPGQHGS